MIGVAGNRRLEPEIPIKMGGGMRETQAQGAGRGASGRFGMPLGRPRSRASRDRQDGSVAPGGGRDSVC